jgi:hypothetical protein
VLNHVLLHQTMVAQEAMKHLGMANGYPEVIIGCTGGGSNFAGIVFPFLGAQLRGARKVRIVAIEPAACPSLTPGKFAYDFEVAAVRRVGRSVSPLPLLPSREAERRTSRIAAASFARLSNEREMLRWVAVA